MSGNSSIGRKMPLVIMVISVALVHLNDSTTVPLGRPIDDRCCPCTIM